MKAKPAAKPKDPEAVTIGRRLESIILTFFDSQVKFSEKTHLTESVISEYISGNRKITDRAAIKMQELAGINANYLLNGIEPMMIADVKPEKSYKPKYQGDIPRANNTLDVTRSLATYLNLTKSARKEHLDSTGKGDIVDIMFDGIRNPIMIMISSDDFCKKYNVENGAIIIINESYTNGDIVLASIDNTKHVLGEYAKTKLIDLADKTEIPITDDIRIIGMAYRKTERF